MAEITIEQRLAESLAHALVEGGEVAEEELSDVDLDPDVWVPDAGSNQASASFHVTMDGRRFNVTISVEPAVDQTPDQTT